MNSLDKMEDYDRLAAALAKEKAKNKELRREVAVLRDAERCPECKDMGYYWKTVCGGVEQEKCEVCYENPKSLFNAKINTQETAEAFEREVVAKEVALVKLAALELAEEWSGYVVEDTAPHTNKVFIELHLDERVDELRAANKGEGIV